MTNTVVKIKEFSGNPSFLFTFAKTLDAGNPRSLAKAYVMRLDVVMMPIVANTRHIRGKMSKQTAPVLDEVPLYYATS